MVQKRTALTKATYKPDELSLVLRPIGIGFILLTTSVLFSGIDVYLARVGLLPAKAAAIAFAMMLSLFAAAVLKDVLQSGGVRSVAVYSALFPSLFAFAVIVQFKLVFAVLPGSDWENFDTAALLYPYNLVLVLFAVTFPMLTFFRENFTTVMLVAFLTAVGSILFEVLNPGSFYQNLLRSAGFSGNPNLAATTVTCLCVLAVSWDRIRRRDVMIWGLAIVAVIATFSRGGMLLLLISLVFYLFSLSKRLTFLGRLKMMSVMTFGLAVIGGILMVAFGEIISQIFNIPGALDRLFSLVLILQGDTSIISDDARAMVFMHYLSVINEAPLFGHGTGFSNAGTHFVYGTHNMYLTQWVDNGVLGILAYLLFLGVLFWQFSRFQCMSGIAILFVWIIGSVFSHNLLLQRQLLILLFVALSNAYFDWRHRNRAPQIK